MQRKAEEKAQRERKTAQMQAQQRYAEQLKGRQETIMKKGRAQALQAQSHARQQFNDAHR